LIAERRFDEAITTLQKALALDPALALARNNLSWALQEKAKHGK
jgi:tetratricopeptide (TPR) repeat protein